MDKNKSDGNSDNRRSNETIVGISVIGSLVSKAVSNTSQILSGLKQILFFYRLLPDEWKKKAFWIFEKLWSKKLVVISTDPEQPEKIYGVTFDDDKLNNMFNRLPIADQAIILQGKSMVDLISGGLHGDSDEIKNNVEDRYGQRGLNIEGFGEVWSGRRVVFQNPLLQLVSDMKTCQELRYDKMVPDISESGFCKSLRIKISF